MTRFAMITIAGAAIATCALLLAGQSGPAAAEGRPVPAPAVVSQAKGHHEVAILAGGCFWGVEGVYEHVRGVTDVVSGFAGGTTANADYEQVSAGGTGKAEAVRIIFDPSKVSYAELLRIYFSVVADPTQLNRQGPDTGPQYRTAIFPQSAAQDRVARAYIAQLSKAHVFKRPIVTRIEPTRRFIAADAYHQDFMRKNPAHPYIVVHDRPKVAALKRLFPTRYRG
jgi:peptide-methionine (S)-S-oxide reductase